ncbi:hypothetical protein O181_126436 [Austropuccinia psidii MF-1]|uniref:Uncharacterized protein n=1 Tax=Austropuccinia psidii MF-1 TaxID=1389203 RepID=A0A9Q3KV24_9BASI|nr:hypothetical protein [Austropuccinia psidii MF-1]
MGAYKGTGGPTLAQYNQSEPSLLVIMQQMTHIMATIQAASSSESSRPPAFKTTFMKAPECLDGTQPSKSEASLSPANLFLIIIWQISLKTERKSFMPLHFLLAGLQNRLSLIFPISPIKIQITFSILGIYLNLNSLLCLGTQMKSEKRNQSWIP